MSRDELPLKRIIRNYSEAGRTPLRSKALDIFLEGLSAVMPHVVIPGAVRADRGGIIVQDKYYDLARGKLYVIGGGKAAGMMAKVIESIVNPVRISRGAVVDKSISVRTEVIQVLKGGHPIPNKEGVLAVKKMLEVTKSLSHEDLVICVFSGGGSSLLALPVEGVSIEDLETLNRQMLVSGMPVHEMNIVRKHISQISGGRLAKLLQPARVVALVISDTFDCTYDATASGPTVPDRSTYAMAVDILIRYGIYDSTPKSIVAHLENGRQGNFSETVRPQDPIFHNVQNVVVANNSTALEAMRQFAISEGYSTTVLSSRLIGDVGSVSQTIIEAIREVSVGGRVCLLAGGEPTVHVTGSGQGGRCQQLAAMVSRDICGLGQSVFVAAGTDGSDFLPDIDGAIVDDKSLDWAAAKRLDVNEFIASNDTYNFHRKLKNLIRTGSINTNVSDLMVFLHHRASKIHPG